jgi:hypothetical protein
MSRLSSARPKSPSPVTSRARSVAARLKSSRRSATRRCCACAPYRPGRARDPKLRSSLTDARVHLRGGRLCLALKAKSSGRVKGVLHDRSASEQTVYIEPDAVVGLSNRQSDCRLEERREVNRILSELARVVLDAEEGLVLAARGSPRSRDRGRSPRGSSSAVLGTRSSWRRSGRSASKRSCRSTCG